VSSSGLAQRNFKQGAIGGTRICGLFEHGTLLKILCIIWTLELSRAIAWEVLERGESFVGVVIIPSCERRPILHEGFGEGC